MSLISQRVSGLKAPRYGYSKSKEDCPYGARLDITSGGPADGAFLPAKTQRDGLIALGDACLEAASGFAAVAQCPHGLHPKEESGSGRIF